MTDGLSEYEVRAALAKQGIGVSNAQLKEWRDWGLLEQLADGRWEPITVAKAVRIHELGGEVRSLARRVIRLNAEAFRVLPTDVDQTISGALTEAFFRIPPEQLRRAMVEVAPQIKTHLRKMKQVEAAIAAFHARTAPGSGSRGSRLPRGWRPPRKEEWVTVLEQVPLEVFAQSAGTQEYFASLLRSLLADPSQVLKEIPREEQIVLLTVRDLASWRTLQQRGRTEAATTQPKA